MSKKRTGSTSSTEAPSSRELAEHPRIKAGLEAMTERILHGEPGGVEPIGLIPPSLLRFQLTAEQRTELAGVSRKERRRRGVRIGTAKRSPRARKPERPRYAWTKQHEQALERLVPVLVEKLGLEPAVLLRGQVVTFDSLTDTIVVTGPAGERRLASRFLLAAEKSMIAELVAEIFAEPAEQGEKVAS